MKSDLDRLMTERGLDAAVVFGPDGFSPVNAHFNYFVGGRHIIGWVIKKRGSPAVLIHGTMERDDAAQTGLELINVNRWPRKEIETLFPNPFDARVEMNRRIFTDLGVTGKVGVYGAGETGHVFALLRQLEKKVPGLEIVAEGHRDLIQTARETKDDAEIEAMRDVGVETCALIDDVKKFLQSHRSRDGVLVRSDGKPLTVADVKRFAHGRLVERRLEQADDFIFSIGRDAGVPHNRGNPADPIPLGKTIIFDIFPRRPGGYFHDVTRTWCLGFAPPEATKAWQDVKDAFDLSVRTVKPFGKTHPVQLAICEFFESRGHKTIRQDPAHQEGYIHGLGHGLGLDVHEQPPFPTFSDPGSTVGPGVVFTIEPGLYYPSQGFGMRLEDTYVCDAQGAFHSLTPYPFDLVVPMA